MILPRDTAVVDIVDIVTSPHVGRPVLHAFVRLVC